MSLDGGYTVPPTDANLNCLSQEYLYEDLRASTEDFSSSSRLGQGTYGSVYQGTLRDGTEVAVKVLSKPNEAGFREEVEVLSKFRHPNLVILMGFARNSKERYLVYELLPGGDVCARLQKDPTFTWRPRLHVALDSALGLSHLHCARPQVFHRDIKTQNILMDRNGMAKMADFGLALLAQPNEESLTVEHTSGTIGYADPLYIRTGVVTERSEVYSFGMVLLELLTGRPPALQHVSGRIEYQFAHIGGEFSRVKAMLDPRARIPSSLATGMGQLALHCVSSQESSRPSFVDIVRQLKQLVRDHPENSPVAAAPPRDAASPLDVSAASVAKNGPFLGAGGSNPPWAAGVQVRPAANDQQERLQRHRERQAAQVGIVGGNPNHQGQPAVNLAGQRASASSDSRFGEQDGANAFLLGSRDGADGSPAANPVARRRPSDPGDVDQRAYDQAGPFSSLGGSPHEVDVRAVTGEQARQQSGSDADYAGAAVQNHRSPPADEELLRPAERLERRFAALEQLRARNGYADAQSGGSDRRKRDPAGSSRSAEQPAPVARQQRQQHGLMEVLSEGSLVDDSPACVVDCGSPGPAEVQPGEGTPVDVDLRPDAAQGAKPFLLPFAPNAGYAPQPLGVGDFGQEQSASSSGPPGTGPPSTGVFNQQDQEQQEVLLQQLQDEMGFSRYQVTEAFKRCSTAEAAVDWILSPEREWAESWGT